MVYSISIAVDNPLRVAIALSEIWRGRYFPLVPLPHSYTVLPPNDLGTAVEIHPNNTEYCVTQSEIADAFFRAQFAIEPRRIRGAIAVAASREAIEFVAARERWETQIYRFGLFELVELWIDSRLRLELLPEQQNTASFLPKSVASTSPDRVELLVLSHQSPAKKAWAGNCSKRLVSTCESVKIWRNS